MCGVTCTDGQGSPDGQLHKNVINDVLVWTPHGLIDVVHATTDSKGNISVVGKCGGFNSKRHTGFSNGICGGSENKMNIPACVHPPYVQLPQNTLRFNAEELAKSYTWNRTFNPFVSVSS